MAAQSRLALRSSHRGSVGLGEVPPTLNQRNPSPANTRKRTRDPSTDLDNPKPPKRLHDSPDVPRRTVKVYSSKRATRDIVAPALGEAVTHRAVNSHAAPQRPTPIVQRTHHGPAPNNLANGRSPTYPSTETHQSPLTIKKADKRSLRSHDGGSRFKSELALYFADYDEILTDEPKTQEFLTPATRIHIVDEPSSASAFITSAPIATTGGSDSDLAPFTNHEPALNAQGNNTANGDNAKLNHAERVDFSTTERHARHFTEDPLADEFYWKAHRRAERGEKSQRNRERESAQHEKFQLERIVDELKGPSWLKTMGITGITDSEKKSYEPKRAIFIQRVTALLNKFRAWKEEEKRRKAEREQPATTEDEDEEQEDGLETDQFESPGRYDGVNERDGTCQMSMRSSRARRHIHREATLDRTEAHATSRNSQRQDVNLVPFPLEKPFTSFYTKSHLRDAALSKHRRGRLRFAFGQQVPELEQRDFNLPSEMLTTKFIAANARSRRAARRDSKDQTRV
ncbi:MAG: hypothetical protein Q9184_003345 [Pyrenodesmia sp. 2 TL-2023]